MRKLLYFGSVHCPPCKFIRKSFVEPEIAAEVPEQVEFLMCEDNLQLVKQYHIKHTPTMILLDENGKEAARYVGSIHPTGDQIVEWLQGGKHDNDSTY